LTINKIIGYITSRQKQYLTTNKQEKVMRKIRYTLSFIFAVTAVGSAYLLSINGQAENAMGMGIIFAFFSVIVIPDSKVKV
jgi:hypothetical protein